MTDQESVATLRRVAREARANRELKVALELEAIADRQEKEAAASASQSDDYFDIRVNKPSAPQWEALRQVNHLVRINLKPPRATGSDEIELTVAAVNDEGFVREDVELAGFTIYAIRERS